MKKRLKKLLVIFFIIVIFYLSLSLFNINGRSVNSQSSVLIGVGAPPVPPTPPAAGPGGGGAGIEKLRTFTVSPELIKVGIKQGETITKFITIKNTGNVISHFTLDTDMKRILLSETEFSLNPKEEKIITVDISAASDDNPDLYLGKIIVKNEDFTKIVRIILELSSKKALFDIQTTIPLLYKIIPKNENTSVNANILIKNLGDIYLLDVNLYYAIKDFDGNIITSKEETLAIKDLLSLYKTLLIPYYAKEGEYLFYSKVNYENSTAISSDSFKIVKSSILFNVFTIPVFSILIILIIILLIIKYIYNLKFKVKHLLKKIEYNLNNNEIDKAIKLYKRLERFFNKMNSIDKIKVYPGIKKIYNRIKIMDSKRKKLILKNKTEAVSTISELLKKIEKDIKNKRIDLAIRNYTKLEDYYKNMKDSIKLYIYPKIKDAFNRIEIKSLKREIRNNR